MHLPRGKNGIVFLIALIALIIPVILLENNLLRHTGGNIVFPLDGAFLDISVAKNLAFYKVWGLSKYGFQPASASLLYPVVLALLFFITGAHLIIPIVLNGMAAICLLYVLQQVLIRRKIKASAQLAVLLLVILLTGLPLLIVSGRYYTLQLLISFLFLESLARAIQEDRKVLPRKVYLYGMLAVATRYEDILLVLFACILLVSVKRRGQALKLAGIALLPPVVFGTMSLIYGDAFFPGPLLPDMGNNYIFWLAVAAVISGGLLIRRQLSFTLLILLAIPFTIGNLVTLRHFETDSVRIYQQQYPVAGFVHRYFRRSTIGVNDIGAVAYFSEGRKLDYTGVVSPDVTKSKQDRSWGPLLADSLSRKDGVRAAIVSDPWFGPEQFPRWNRIASWKIPNGAAGAARVVNFYAINNYDSAWMLNNLHEFEPLLPEGIAVRYY